jgi:hypothetical protein
MYLISAKKLFQPLLDWFSKKNTIFVQLKQINIMKRQMILDAKITINVQVKGKYLPGSLSTMEDPGESPDFDIEEVWYNGMNITSLIDRDEEFDWEELISSLSDSASNIEPDMDDYND